MVMQVFQFVTSFNVRENRGKYTEFFIIKASFFSTFLVVVQN